MRYLFRLIFKAQTKRKCKDDSIFWCNMKGCAAPDVVAPEAISGQRSAVGGQQRSGDTSLDANES